MPKTLTPMQKWIVALVLLAIGAAWQVGLRAFTPAGATDAERIAEIAAAKVAEQTACILDQLADHRLENAAAHRSDAVDHGYALEEKGVEADPRRVEQLVNPKACAIFLDQE